MTTSTRPSILLALSTLSAFASAFVQLFIYAGIGIVLFAPGAHTNVAAAILVFTLSVAVAVAIGIIAATLQISIQKGSAVLWALGSCSWLMAGTLFPVSALPRPARVLSNLLPFTHSLTGMRLAMFQPLTSPLLQTELRTLALFAALLLPLSIAFFSWTVRRARQLGTLSYY